jgi:hypothetical protein
VWRRLSAAPFWSVTPIDEIGRAEAERDYVCGSVPWRCHRSLIADALPVRGIQVDEIMSMNRPQVHSLIPFARVQGHRITHPFRNRGGGRFPLVRFPENYGRTEKPRFKNVMNNAS